MEQDPEIDNITKARDIYRKNPRISASELKDELGLPTTKVAQEILKSAIAKEQDLKNKLAAEDAAGQQAQEPEPEVEQVPWLKDAETGASHRLRVDSGSKRSVVFEFAKPGNKIVRG